MAFRLDLPIRFGQCDPAGIVYFPRYFEMINAVVEDWFAEVIGASFNALHVEQRMGVPTAHLDTDFLAPSFLGEQLSFELDVARIGGASLALDIHARCADEPRLRCRSTLVYVNLEDGRPRPWPDTLRQRFEAERNEGTD